MRAIHAVILAVVCLQVSATELADAANSRGVELFRQARYIEAEKEYRKALFERKQNAAEDVVGYAVALNNLAGVLQTQGRSKEARELLTAVIRLDSRLPPDSPIVTHALNNLSLLHQADRDFAKAIAVLKRALNRTEPVSATRAGTLHNLGAMYSDLGQEKKAAEYFEASLKMHTEVGAVTETPPTLGFLARLATRSGDSSRARALLDRALALRREMYHGDHPLIGFSLSDLGEFYRDSGNFDQAAIQFEAALDVLGRTVGLDHPYAGAILMQYGHSRRLQGNYEQALELFQQVIEVFSRLHGPDHIRLAAAYRRAAECAEKLGRKTEAKQLKSHASAIEDTNAVFRRNTIDVSAFTAR